MSLKESSRKVFKPKVSVTSSCLTVNARLEAELTPQLCETHLSRKQPSKTDVLSDYLKAKYILRIAEICCQILILGASLLPSKDN